MKRKKMFSGVKNQSGMTILELLIVAGIIITAGYFIMKSLNDKRHRIKSDLTLTQMRDLKVQLEQYRDQYSMYPNGIQGLDALIERPIDEPIPNEWRPFISDESLIKDQWGTKLDYESDAEGMFFIIRSFGRDGKPGGKGFDYDIEVRSD
jgi:general secretion pathway protein G